jgi:YD repeat-containing protein
LTITYNRRNQTTGISDVYGTLVPMTYAGAGQGERLSAGWSNQPSPTDPTKPPEYGNTTYTYSALGLMSKTDTTGTTSYTRAPSGQPISERTPNGTFYYILDGLGNAVMLVDPPNGAPAWISAICPTGNDAGGSWQSPTIGGGNVGNQNILTYAAYVPSGSFDAGTHNFHSLWGYQSTDNGNNQATNNPCFSNAGGNFLGELVNAACLAFYGLAHGTVIVPTPSGGIPVPFVSAASPPPPGGNGDLDRSDLNGSQQSNLDRFINKLPSGAGPVTITSSNGTVQFSSDVPAANVPGSFARYAKTVDANGVTIGYV